MGTTPIYGFPYPDPSDLVANYPALGQELAEDIEAVLPTLGGLQLITTQSFSAAASFSVNNCFSATYRNYRVIVNIPTVSVNAQTVSMKLRASGTDSSVGYYYAAWVVTSSAGTGTQVGSNLNEFNPMETSNTGRVSLLSMDLGGPFTTNRTTVTYNYGAMTGVAFMRHGAGTHDVSTSYDGFTMTVASGNMTGNVEVYGYQI